MANPNTDGYIYLIQATGTDRYKIGMTTRSLEERLSELRRQSPFPLECLGYSWVPNARRTETDLHNYFGQYRLEFKGSKEWFEFPYDFLMNEVIPVLESLEPDPEPQPIYHRSSSGLDLIPFEGLAIGAIAILALLGLASLGRQIEPNWASYDSALNAALVDDYDTAIINFQRFANTTPAGCLNEYAVQMVKAAQTGKELANSGYSLEDAYDQYVAIADQANEQATANGCWQQYPVEER